MSQKSLWGRLKSGLRKTSEQLGGQLRELLKNRKLDASTLDEFEDLLIQSDLGVKISNRLRESLSKQRLDQEITDEGIKNFLADEIEGILKPVATPLSLSKTESTQVVLVVGVNGSGKTTTISKFAKGWSEEGLKVELVACDTFRAAAVQQLQIWGGRLGIPVYTAPDGADAAGLAFEAVTKAKANKADVLFIDTAGRLHNKEGLMNELQKVIRVIKKVDETAPHHTLLVLDATTGQNAHSQVKIFKEMAGVTGLIVTKLDGTAKGGVVVSLADQYGLPIHAIGVGEQAEDLQIFDAHDFAQTLVGLEPTKTLEKEME
ncbi:MAG: signal recognition particle-docking protein FtsY [Alphaproteobacteria bacterium]|nr:signal recognition particle-docking protein FtsY [Alphaproteobacteria bacterium]